MSTLERLHSHFWLLIKTRFDIVLGININGKYCARRYSEPITMLLCSFTATIFCSSLVFIQRDFHTIFPLLQSDINPRTLQSLKYRDRESSHTHFITTEATEAWINADHRVSRLLTDQRDQHETTVNRHISKHTTYGNTQWICEMTCHVAPHGFTFREIPR